MLHQVQYRYIAENRKIRSEALIIDAKDVHEARKNAMLEIRKEHDHFEIGTIRLFGALPK